VENALKVNPVLGPQMFQRILPCVFRGVIEGEVRFSSVSRIALDFRPYL
jgi:hypothetical protein